MTELLIIITSIVYIWQHSGFIYDLSKLVYTKLNKGKQYMGQSLIKPIGCYTCMIFWVTSVYYYMHIQSNIIFAIGIGTASSIAGILIDKILMIIIRLIHKIS